MNDPFPPSSPGRTGSTAATWAGLSIALFGLLIVRWVVALFRPSFSFANTLWKEALIWLCAIALLVIIRRGEGETLRSINLGTKSWKHSLLWGIVVLLLCGLVGMIVANLTHFKGGETGAGLAKLPIWLVVFVVLRAGVVEELFYRGYAIDRLQRLGLNRWVAAAVPLLIFGGAHWTNGWENAVLALALGVVLTAVYLWRRDLVANMIGHFLVDFIGVVLPRLAAHT